MICPFLLVPPHAQYVLSFCAMLDKFEFLSSMPSTMVVALPNFRVSRRMRIRCCSFSISPQTHRSFGNPHVEQTSAMTLNRELSTEIYKSFKGSEMIFLGYEWLCLLEMEFRSFLLFFRLFLPLASYWKHKLKTTQTQPQQTKTTPSQL